MIYSLLYLQYLFECTKETFSENLSTVRIGVMFLFQFSLLFKLFILTMYHFSKKSAKCPSTNNWLKKMQNINIMLCHAALFLVSQSRPTFYNPMDCSPLVTSVHVDSLGKNTGMDFYALLQGIFPTQGLNPALLHCRWILY